MPALLQPVGVCSFVCTIVCACARVCMRVVVCACACLRVYVFMPVCACVRVCLHAVKSTSKACSGRYFGHGLIVSSQVKKRAQAVGLVLMGTSVPVFAGVTAAGSVGCSRAADANHFAVDCFKFNFFLSPMCHAFARLERIR
jgi:hypothetical protein